MAIEVDQATGSAYWASYLINGDPSGIDDRDVALCDAWQRRLEPWYVVDVADNEEGEPGEAHFSWSYGLHTGDESCSGGDVLEYLLHKQV